MELHAVDSETPLIVPSLLAPQLVCVSAATSPQHGQLFHHTDPRCFEYLEYVLDRCGMTTANGPYDLAVFGRRWPSLIPLIFQALDEDRVFDVLTREKLIDIGRGFYRIEEDEDGNFKRALYNLADVSRRRLGILLEKDEWRLRYHDLIDVPLERWPEGAKKYALDDALSTFGVHAAQEPQAAYIPDQFAQVRAHWALHLMSCWGIRTDLKSVLALERRVSEELEEVKQILVEYRLVRDDGSRDTKAAKEIMLHALGPDVVITNKALERVKKKESTREQEILNGNISLSRDVCLLSGHEALFKYGRYGQLQNLLRKDVKDLKRGTVIPIQTRFNYLMETGRTSSSSPNIQNLRREPGVRECFVPREGNVFVAADYTTAELVSLSQVCLNLFGYSKMAEAINAGMDVHLYVAAKLLRIPYEIAVAAYKDKKDALYGEVKAKRQLAKALNFGYPGGLGAKTFIGYAKGYGVELSFEESSKLKQDWLEAWPEMREYFRWIGNQADGDGWHWIKQHVSNRVRGRAMFTQAANSMFQGLTADAAKAATYEMVKSQFLDTKSPLFGTSMVNFVHDEDINECREEIGHEVAMEMKRIMEVVYQRYTPDVKIEVEPTIMRFWSKKAEQVWHDQHGNVVHADFPGPKRLMPWGRKVAA